MKTSLSRSYLPVIRLVLILGLGVFSGNFALSAFAAGPGVNSAAPARAVSPAWVSSEAAKLKASGAVALTSLRASARQKLTAAGTMPANSDVDAAVQQVLQAASQQVGAELKDVLSQMEALNKKKSALRAKADSLSELSPQDQLKLQQLMEQKSKLEKVLANVMKASSDTASDLAKNMK